MTVARLAFLAAVIASGLGLRAYGYALGLPFLVVKYGGSVLWGAMVYALVAIACATLCGAPRHVLPIAALIALAVELSRLIHTPWLDAFRLTPMGALSLGRVFSLWNLAAYAAGIAMAAAMLRVLSWKKQS